MQCLFILPINMFKLYDERIANFHTLPQRRQELFFLSHHCDLFEESCSYLPDVKLLPKIQFRTVFRILLSAQNILLFFTLSSRNIIVFWYLIYHIIPFRLRSLDNSTNCVYKHKHFFSSSFVAVFQFYFNFQSSQVWNVTAIRLLRVRYCKLVSSSPVHSPHLSLPHIETYKLRIFPMISIPISTKIHTRVPSLPETSAVSEAMTNLLTRTPTNLLSFQTRQQIADSRQQIADSRRQTADNVILRHQRWRYDRV